ncbi:MAG: mechanosensitive ion channel family protein, partial [Gammaproteobacteria bacterium]|nr:mechanosensitive ion channel family protein [Gammaproteobacteria bacterium]
MKNNNYLPQLRAGLLILVLAAVAPASAQTPVDEGAADANGLSVTVERIKTNIADFQQLEAQLEEVEPGFRILLRSRLDERQRAVFEQVDALAARLLESSRRGDSIDEYSPQVVEWLQVLMQRANAFLARNRQTIQGRLKEQNSTDPVKAADSVVELDLAIERTVSMVRNLFRMIERLDDFGVDVAEERAQLTLRVREAAEMLAVAIHLDADELTKLRAQLALLPSDANLQALVKVADLRRNGYAENLSNISRLLEDLGVDSSEYRRLVLVVTGDVASQILDTGVMGGLAREWGARALSWINDNGLGWAIKLIVFILILMAFRAVSKLTRRWAGRGMRNVRISVLLRQMIVSTAANVVMLLGILIALSQLGISLGPLLAGLGVLGFIIGFALQDTLGNFASGMMILLYRP